MKFILVINWINYIAMSWSIALGYSKGWVWMWTLTLFLAVVSTMLYLGMLQQNREYDKYVATIHSGYSKTAQEILDRVGKREEK